MSPIIMMSNPLAFEDLTTYTEVDANGKLTVTASKATGANIDQDEDVLLYKDFGVSFFNAITLNFTIRIESTSLAVAFAGPGFTTSVVDTRDAWDTTDIAVNANITAGSTIQLVRGFGVAIDQFSGSSDTTYYCTLKRTAASDTVTLEIYDDAGRTNLVDTLSVAGFGGATRYRYLYAMSNSNTATGGRDWDGFTEDFQIL